MSHGASSRGRHLVEKRLELVVVVPVEQRDRGRHVPAGKPLRARDAREASADDDDLGGPVLAHRNANINVCITRGHHPDGMISPDEMPQALVTELPGSSRISPSPLRKAFGGQVIGSTARLRRFDVGQRVTGEEHQVGVGLVHPDA